MLGFSLDKGNLIQKTVRRAKAKALQASQVLKPSGETDPMPELLLGDGGPRRGIADLKLPTINIPA